MRQGVVGRIGDLRLEKKEVNGEVVIRQAFCFGVLMCTAKRGARQALLGATRHALDVHNSKEKGT